MLEIPGFRLLLDCGLFQGSRDEAHRQNRDVGFDPKSLSAVLLSHAHVDHSGALPVLQKHGFSGKTYLTRATADLTELMLEDSARVQVGDFGYVNKKEQRNGRACVRPLYDTDDVRKLVRRFEGTRYGDMLKITPRVTASFHDASHILGSAAIRVKYTVRGNRTTVLFSSDLGLSNMTILRDPEPPHPCDVLILESTYDDRLHEADGEIMKQKTLDLLTHAKTHKSKIIVPAFAVGRTQELVMWIKELVGEGSSPEDRKRLNSMKGPCVIISASGMCEGGRVVHHLKHAIQDEANVIVFVGFQAEHTLGRKLVEGWDVVPIFGVPTPRRAQIVKLNGLSAHADRQDLLAYVRAIRPGPSKIFLVHGEEKQALSLAAAIQAEQSKIEFTVPHVGSSHEV
ncbi:MAG: MBL fold metallo-hydrolase [Nitrospirae bacterium]|nr:MAG: MBL fold metallo-hydrolase [Nitrospirota bacterium]